MQLAIQTILTIVLLVSCNQPPPTDSVAGQKSDSVISGITHEFLQGSWTSYSEHCDYSKCKEDLITRDGITEDHPQIINWLVKGDSIWVFQYPCQFYFVKSFKIKSDSIYFDGNRIASAQLNKFGNDDDGLFQIISTGDNRKPVITQIFTRDSFDIKTIEMLKHDSVNMECLTGKMKIVTHFKPEDGEAYDVTFPIQVPKYIDIKSKDDAQAVYDKKQIMILIGGVNKLFYVDAIEWNNFDYNYPDGLDWQKVYEKNHGQKHYIVVRPAEWYTGEPFTVTYAEE